MSPVMPLNLFRR
ncbi:hypothetical protein F383_37187 [Gossypium arboreum]|uniref:Uncharacterized protein n=1 Tax=Gossypium arboreum TaxID=29729 RepID=A0A0B0MBX9_GOSAR|nr:hypothetical protein F383_37187 [Gossypium arboreum]